MKRLRSAIELGGDQTGANELLDSITLIKALPCLDEPGKFIVIGRSDRSLEEVHPYLATLLRASVKPFKMAMVACMRKWLIILNAMLRKIRPGSLLHLTFITVDGSVNLVFLQEDQR